MTSAVRTCKKHKYRFAQISITSKTPGDCALGKVFDALCREGIWCEIVGIHCPETEIDTSLIRVEISPIETYETAEKIEGILAGIPEKHITAIQSPRLPS